jgi:hypothetical protein
METLMKLRMIHELADSFGDVSDKLKCWELKLD